jgi:hypothetical protein
VISPTSPVHLLHHQSDPDDDETSLLLGVCSSRERALAQSAVAAPFRAPGFLDACLIDECGIDEDELTTGFECLPYPST